MQIIFTSLSTANMTRFSNVKPSGFMFEEPNVGSLKVMSTSSAGAAGNGTISDAVGTIAGAINESSSTEERHRLLLELEIVSAYFKNNSEISEFLDKVLMKLGDVDDWD